LLLVGGLLSPAWLGGRFGFLVLLGLAACPAGGGLAAY